MRAILKSITFATGLAMFSMFFGAGNVVFPLALGQYAQDKNLYAILGLLVTAVGVPFTGLIAMTLFNGDYSEFFYRIGRVPGFLVAAAIMGLIGPFGAIPRCISLSYATIKIYTPELSLVIFSILACVVIFMLTFRKNNILEVLGYVLTPLLLGSLALIIIKGMIDSPAAPAANHAPGTIFLKGLLDGYQTMDLLGAFFFSSVVLSCLEKGFVSPESRTAKRMIVLALKAAAIGAGLLTITYIGFSYVAAFNSESLATVSKDELAGRLANLILGPVGGLVACIAVALACLTTAIALSAVFAEFAQTHLFADKIRYETALLGTLVISFFVSTLHFNGIVLFLHPILQVCYPALIVLSVLNIFYKLYHFKPVKTPVAIVFILSLVGYFVT